MKKKKAQGKVSTSRAADSEGTQHMVAESSVAFTPVQRPRTATGTPHPQTPTHLMQPLPGSSGEKEARIEIRVEQSLKELIETAAAVLGQTVSSFIITHVIRDAQAVIKDHGSTQVTLSDWTRFQEILATPARPNAALRKATRRYKNTIAHSDDL